MRDIIKNFLIFFIVFVIIAGIFSFYSQDKKKIDQIGIQALVSEISDEKVDKMEVSGDKINIQLKDGTAQVAQKETMESLGEMLKNYNADFEKVKKVVITVKDESGWKFWLSSLLPMIIPFLFIAGFIYFMFRQAQGANSKAMSFGQVAQETGKEEKKLKVTFRDVAGAKEAKEELEEIVEFLKFPQKFLSLGAKIRGNVCGRRRFTRARFI